MFLKKALSTLALATLALSAHAADVVLKVAASAVPHAEILNFVKPQLKAQGVDLQVREFSDYIQPNAAVEDKQLDANFFQHQPYLDSYNKGPQEQHRRGARRQGACRALRRVLQEDQVDQRTQGRRDHRHPNDPSNAGRALLLLQKQGLITLKDPRVITSTPIDIVKITPRS